MHWDQEPDNAVGARLWYVFSGGLKVTPNVLPASCRQTVACRIVPFCRQDAGSTLNRYRLCEPQRLATAPVLRVTDPRSGTAGSWRAPTLFLARIGTLNRAPGAPISKSAIGPRHTVSNWSSALLHKSLNDQ